eukprot:m.88771 g.88771  ORF g.88771 m.88771 type:complete len:137 (-) comp21476_c0_seq2:162-572(-)
MLWASHKDTISCIGYRGMYHYQFAFANDTYPLQTPTPKYNMYIWPQAYCTYKDHGDSWCLPNPSGGSFSKNATINLKTSHGYAVRYTTDGSIPTSNSSVASGPVVITETTTFTVQLVNETIAAGNPPTVMTFVKVD